MVDQSHVDYLITHTGDHTNVWWITHSVDHSPDPIGRSYHIRWITYKAGHSQSCRWINDRGLISQCVDQLLRLHGSSQTWTGMNHPLSRSRWKRREHTFSHFYIPTLIHSHTLTPSQSHTPRSHPHTPIPHGLTPSHPHTPWSHPLTLPYPMVSPPHILTLYNTLSHSHRVAVH